MTVSKNHYRQGTSPADTELNSPYDQLATQSQSVSDENTASNWSTLKHFAPGYQCNRLFSYKNESSSTVTINSTSYTTISITALNAEINLSSMYPDKNEATRFAAAGLVRQTSVSSDVGDNNYYAFRLLLTYDDGAGDVTETIGEWGYSLTSRALVTTVATGGTADTIQYQTFQFSSVRRYDGTTGSRQYKKLELQAKVNDATNSINVSRHQLFVISGRK